MKILKGEPLAEGAAEGYVCLYRENMLAAAPRYAVPPGKVKQEISRLHAAIEKAKQELKDVYSRASRNLSATEAEIFFAHIMILEDATFIKRIEDFISSNRANAEYAAAETIEEYKKTFAGLPAEYIRERGEDLNDIAKRIIYNLGSRHTGFACSGCRPSSAVAAAEHLTTSLISNLGASPAGILVEKGSPVSHGAIMAKALGVPVLIRVENLLSHLGCGTPVIIDAGRGRVYIRPGAKTLQRYRGPRPGKKPFRKVRGGVVETRDGEKIRIAVNASGIADIKRGMEKGVIDVGLFRTEFLFTGRKTRPGMDEQAGIYSRIIGAVKGDVAFRLLDAGTDKEMPYLGLPPQGNPDLGLRGVRLYRQYPEILEEQAGALFMAKNGGPLRIIVPMVSAIGEFLEARRNILRKFREMSKGRSEYRKGIKFGCMIELPSAVHTIEDFVRECDFLSVGTNDLIQYLTGADRGNDYLDGVADPFSPAVARVLKIIIDRASAADRETVVCGEMAGAPRTAALLVGLGYRGLSMNPAGIEETVRHLRKSSAAGMRSAAESLLNPGR